MELRNLGKSGLRVSVVGLGCNNFGARMGDAEVPGVVNAALDAGVTLFDTADSYGGRGRSEQLLGAALGNRRKDVVLASKFGIAMDEAGRLQGGSRRYIYQAVEASLTRLRTDWIDLYQVHRPDPHTPLEESLRALEELTRQGKIRYAGVSNHPAWKVAEAVWIARAGGFAPIVSCQDEYSLLDRSAERDLLPAMNHLGVGLLPYRPLMGGLLSGKYRHDQAPPQGARLSSAANSERYLTQSNWRKVEKLRVFCEARGRSLLDLAFSWLACRSPVASVIAGATTPAQVEANIKAASWKLSAEELAEIDVLLK